MADKVQFRVVDGVVVQETIVKSFTPGASWDVRDRAVCMTDGKRFRAILSNVTVHPKKGYRNATLAEVRAHFVEAAKAGDDTLTDDAAGKQFDALVVA
jgi:hypothetical protein